MNSSGIGSLQTVLFSLTAIIGIFSVLHAIRTEAPTESDVKRTVNIPAFAPGGGPGKGEGGVVPFTPSPPTILPAVTPVERHMSDVVITLDDPTSTYNRWLRGEDIDEAHLISKEEMAAMRGEAMNQPVDEDMQDAGRAGGANAPTPSIGFNAIDYTHSGGWVPPDPELAAGTTHLIATVNAAVEETTRRLTTSGRS